MYIYIYKYIHIYMYIYIYIYIYEATFYSHLVLSFVHCSCFMQHYIHLKSDSHLPKKVCVICFIESPLKMKNDVKCFLFHLKSSFSSQDI